MKSLSPPPHWPDGVLYIAESQYHSSVPADLRLELCRKGTSPSGKQSSQRLTVIRRITETSHPACGQLGLFAAKKISPHTHIVDYIGEVHCDDRPESDYDLSLYRPSSGLNVGVDARRMGNEARFINDYRGIKSKPNALFEERRAEGGELRMSVWTSGDPLRKGEEILVSYGKGWWQARSG
ncbi:uncharacterized protein B0H18DRAFT_970515 [Fomitopsis serialis]|uniref:uncharacterized protein n=1 Tax=Fomitopsis serialis TaxID=139415 RepID=UPI00200852BD|nr:uncharacterized protein B0H18DRAFT_970515 [Neoantrodia serialis]KAH9937423.1 hypothetical protein B0H18DRAFT_970515 [Neoantrodia serialis]